MICLGRMFTSSPVLKTESGRQGERGDFLFCATTISTLKLI